MVSEMICESFAPPLSVAVASARLIISEIRE
jgi:hypothetical protein